MINNKNEVAEKMKLLSFLILLSSIFTLNVSAQDIYDTNYGYRESELIIIDEKDSSDYISSDITPIHPESHETYELPEKFDARDKGIIHNSGLGQSSDGTCWAFASTLCTETALGGKINLSENHAKYAASNTGNNIYGYNRAPSEGGNFSMYTAYASNWRGPVLEEYDPYEYGYTERDYETVTAAMPVAYHLQGTLEIPNPASKPELMSEILKESHINEVKYYVYKYGCLFSSMYWSSSYYNTETLSYYNSNASTKANHAVNIIGWDDNYPKENFLTKPEHDGAFIIKNSHGLTGQYFYLSYDDVYAGWDAGAVTSVEDIYNYGELYSHECFQPGGSVHSANNLAKTTNVFTSKHDGEFVSAVGVVTKARNLSYKVYISATGKGDDYDEENYTLCKTGYLQMPGFYTLELDNPFLLGDKGTEYCVRVIFESDKDFPIPLEYKPKGGNIPATYAQPGQSYLAQGVYAPADMGDMYQANLYVKAYTDAEYDIDFETENATISINGSEFIPAEDITAGLNDEITLNFSNITSTYAVNGTEYTGGTEVTLKLTEDLVITEKHPANITVETETESITLDTLTASSDSYTVTVTPDFEEEKTIIVAYYSGNREVGVKTVKANGSEICSIKADVCETPDSLNIIVIDSFSSLNTDFNVLHFDFK